MAYTTWFNSKTGKFETIQLNDNLPKLEVDDEGKVPGSGGGGGFYVGDTPPEDTNLIWIDTSDDSFDGQEFRNIDDLLGSGVIE